MIQTVETAGRLRALSDAGAYLKVGSVYGWAGEVVSIEVVDTTTDEYIIRYSNGLSLSAVGNEVVNAYLDTLAVCCIEPVPVVVPDPVPEVGPVNVVYTSAVNTGVRGLSLSDAANVPETVVSGLQVKYTGSMGYDPATGKVILCGEDQADLGTLKVWEVSPDGTGLVELADTGEVPETNSTLRNHCDYDRVSGKILISKGNRLWTCNRDGSGLTLESNMSVSTYGMAACQDGVNWIRCQAGNAYVVCRNVVSDAQVWAINTGYYGVCVKPGAYAFLWLNGASGETIHRVDIATGANLITVATTAEKGVSRAFWYDEDESKLYYVDGVNLKRCNDDGTGVETVISGGVDATAIGMVLTYSVE